MCDLGWKSLGLSNPQFPHLKVAVIMIPIPKVYHKNEINNTVPAWCTEKLAFTAILICGFPGGSDSKESACNAIDPDSVLGSRSHGGNGKPFQYFCLENLMDRGA